MTSDNDNNDGAPRYDPAEVEPRWQAYWDEHQTFRATRRPGKPKHYVLDMFPYPSGAGLHVGHPEGYTATDIMARYWRMCDHDVLHPMGWDAFGLPAEQYAIQTGTHPADTTAKNVQVFKQQLRTLGFSYDWSREIDTTDPGYVRWTQWIFLKLFERGLAYQEKVSVNWCPALGTVLANEEVIDGLSERGSHPVERRPLRQWLLRITEYAERLAADLEQVDWPEGTQTMQKEWIGRSDGADATFALQGHDGEGFDVFTTRPDTLFGATYCVLAPEHPLVAKVTTEEQRAEVEAYVKTAVNRAERDRIAGVKDKTGVFTGGYAINPVNDQPVPIWVADYVLMTYGTGAIMAVPAHDNRDWAFATKFELPIIEVIKGGDVTKEAYTDHDHGEVVNSGFLDGLEPPAAKQRITEWLQDKGLGKARIQYKLRDWVFSRQRYWGEPFPIYFPVRLADPKGDPRKGDDHEILYDEPIAVADTELPVRLPELEDFAPGDEPAGALARVVDWRYFQRDGKLYARETNTMPQWAGSCWYYLRFMDPHNAERGWSQQADDDWMPVDLYVGGAEHAVLHLLYARFWHKVLFDIGAVKDLEPFIRLVHQGMILGEDGEKMSKARGNVINPDDIVRVHGADALRMYEMFMGPLEAVKPWQTSQISGVVRFRDRVFTVCTRELGDDWDAETERQVHKTIKKVTEDIERMAFNTALSALMVLTNHLMALDPVPRKAAEALCLLIAPFAPHLGEEIWSKLGSSDGSVARAPWPTYDDAFCTDDTIEMGVQVNGKTRGTVTIAVDADADTARAAALAVATVAKHIEGKDVKKFIYVPKRIINFVVR
ncbi:MAG: leucine--tRNA ligase [Deltaproteobacteria bacterium]|nr:leucine--tRNA ligase [Deltaproteobacteria bacterium]